LLGKTALGRGLPLEHFAFPTFGIPDYRAIGPEVERGIVYASAVRRAASIRALFQAHCGPVFDPPTSGIIADESEDVGAAIILDQVSEFSCP